MITPEELAALAAQLNTLLTLAQKCLHLRNLVRINHSLGRNSMLEEDQLTTCEMQAFVHAQGLLNNLCPYLDTFYVSSSLLASYTRAHLDACIAHPPVPLNDQHHLQTVLQLARDRLVATGLSVNHLPAVTPDHVRRAIRDYSQSGWRDAFRELRLDVNGNVTHQRRSITTLYQPLWRAGVGSLLWLSHTVREAILGAPFVSWYAIPLAQAIIAGTVQVYAPALDTP